MANEISSEETRRPTVAGVSSTPLAYRVRDAGTMLGVGRSTIFEMIKDGKLAARKIGAATVIPHSELARVLQESALSDATKRAHARP